MIFNFPRTRFVDENGISGQVLHMRSEQREIEAEIDTVDIMVIAGEIMDKYHSCETALRILQEKYGVNISELRLTTERKNHNRDYYAG